MSRRAPVLAHAIEQHSNPDWLPEARDAVLPELIGGLSGAQRRRSPPSLRMCVKATVWSGHTGRRTC